MNNLQSEISCDNNNNRENIIYKLSKGVLVSNILTPLRITIIERLLSQNRFDDIIYKLALEHNKPEYKEKFHHKGSLNLEPNNKLAFLLLYVMIIGGELYKCGSYDNNKTDVLTWQFHGYLIQFICDNTNNDIRLHIFTSEKNGYKKILSI
jgi:hypothetical protein